MPMANATGQMTNYAIGVCVGWVAVELELATTNSALRFLVTTAIGSVRDLCAQSAVKYIGE